MARKKTYESAESRWQAVLEQDRRAETDFVYAVKTTGIFCRPGCPSRLPNRRNVEFFPDAVEAEKAGYRACKRCSPQHDCRGHEMEQKIIRACRIIEESDRPVPLKVLAAEAHMSMYHFHRLFRRLVGVTPKQYAAAWRANRFREHLETESSVTEAVYAAGFGSGSTAYDRSKDRLAMPPSVYRRGAPGMVIRYGLAECFLGWVIVAATDRGVCAVEFGDEPEALPQDLRNRFPKAEVREAGGEFSDLLRQVVEYIETPGKGMNIPLDIRGTAFQQQVWSLLRQIEAGTTLSYSEVAERIGRPEAVRAVAGACAANPLAVLIPCHRVVTRDGRISGYRWGRERKRRLLEVEKEGKEG